MNKVEAVITDNRSNMIKAIRQQYFAGMIRMQKIMRMTLTA